MLVVKFEADSGRSSKLVEFIPNLKIYYHTVNNSSSDDHNSIHFAPTLNIRRIHKRVSVRLGPNLKPIRADLQNFFSGNLHGL